MSFFSGPTPPYNNPPIEPQFFQPSRFDIQDIILGQTTIIRTVQEHNYALGQTVRLLIPRPYGSSQLNGLQAIVINVITDQAIELDLDSSLNVNEFIQNPITSDVAQIVAIGDVNSGAINFQGRSNTLTFVPGSFINISPN
jgi:hypothetical protein